LRPRQEATSFFSSPGSQQVGQKRDGTDRI
jgi:hypothetical protein